MKSYMKQPIFWLAFGIFSLLSTIASSYLFPKAFSIVNLSVTMNRTQALDRAQELADQYQLGPQAYQQAVIFYVNNNVKTYTELEAGGKEVFDNLIAQNLFQPYQWVVRHFREHDPHEVYFYFTPDGKPYGFSEIISEDAPGAALSEQEAQEIARTEAQMWSIDLSSYSLVESSQEKQPSDRVDHTFVYERIDQKLGDAPYRFTAKVAGNKIKELEYSVKVPEKFNQKYQEMRAANIGIASTAYFLFQFLYLGLGCILGGIILLFLRYLLWRQAALWAAILSLLSVLVHINNLPIAWFNYPTALSGHGFLLGILMSIINTLIYGFFSNLLIISVAESLTRKAFGSQPQLWQTSKPEVASSYEINGQTFLAYLLLPCQLFYALALYFVTTTYFNWWTPSNILFDPNILASYLPWLTPIAKSLNAGFIEECLFRAVPLACAALLGERFGKKNWWIASAFILQILIFGAAHANYPMQPAYARVIELILPSALYGFLYLRFGLLPGIISHVIYDVFWFSLPLFISSADGIWIQKLIVILLCLIPAFVILYGYIKTGSLHELAKKYYNQAFVPTAIVEKIKAPRLQTIISRPHGVYLFLLAMGILGIYGFMQQPFKQDAQPLRTERIIAQEIATDRFVKQITTQDPNAWTPLIMAHAHYQENLLLKYQHLYVFQVGGKQLYDKLMGTYLHSPYWHIRFARFTGTLEERAEQWWYLINKNRPFSKKHVLPETSPGAHLTKEQAQEKIEQFIVKKYKINPKDLEEVSAISEKHPHRTDWKFTYKDPKFTELKTGQAQTIVELNGDTISNYYQNVFVPEKWQREAQDRNNTMQILMVLCRLFFYVLFSIGVAISLIQFTTNTHHIKNAFFMCALLISLFLIMSINSWPAIIFNFNTSQPFSTQSFMQIARQIIQILMQAISIALVITLASLWHTPTRLSRNFSFYFSGIVIGFWFTGVSILAIRCLPKLAPTWADYESLGTYIPYLQHIFKTLVNYLASTCFLLVITTITDYMSVHWQKNRLLCSIGLLSLGFIIMGLTQQPSIQHWFVLSITWSISILVSYIILIRFDLALVPIITGTFFVLQQIVQATYNPYTGALFGIIGAIISIGILSYQWSLRLNKTV